MIMCEEKHPNEKDVLIREYSFCILFDIQLSQKMAQESKQTSVN